eukprot:6174661-Pleurochrysis_carterae.AAC.1
MRTYVARASVRTRSQEFNRTHGARLRVHRQSTTKSPIRIWYVGDRVATRRRRANTHLVSPSSQLAAFSNTARQVQRPSEASNWRPALQATAPQTRSFVNGRSHLLGHELGELTLGFFQALAVGG